MKDLWLLASATPHHLVPMWDGHEKGLGPQHGGRWGPREPGKSKVAVEGSLGQQSLKAGIKKSSQKDVKRVPSSASCQRALGEFRVQHPPDPSKSLGGGGDPSCRC